MPREFGNLGKLLKEKRMQLGYTQSEVGEKLAIHTQFVSNWERGLCAPPNHSFQKIISLFKLDRTQLADVMMADSKISIDAKVFKKKSKKTSA